ncbi:hypothetical protein AgCh_039881 [Apium graveolens]
MASSSSYHQTFSSSASTSPTSWDAFISFRGTDTRFKFTSHLYAALDYAVRTFKDDAKISDSLLQPIRNSKTYIVVFSENYASSTRCLDDLVEILKCCKTMRRFVIPVFYNIDPSVVRNQSGSFNKAFEKHETCFDTDKLAKWRAALKEVGNLSGFQVCENMSEADIINKVAYGVLLEINPMTLDVAEYPVGLDFRVKGITSLLSSPIKGVTRFSICGMGGVGKTTLAKAVYNHIYYRFQGSCFLANVREVLGTEEGVECLQQQLMNDVLKCKNFKIDNVDQGIELIRAKICSTKVLIVIDDLDDPTQLDFFEGPFALGSIIIITTRNEDLLDSIKVEARYKVNELGDAESRQLFSQHAFGLNKISGTYMELSKDILERAGGLPLALKVFGSNLLNQSREGCICIDKLKRDSLHDVENKIVISFDALKLVDPVLQDIFLDIACFFIGQKKKEVVKILETCYLFVNHYIDILKKRCLLTINILDELGMHALLRDMGRKIACNNSYDDPGKYSRLWISENISDVLKNNKGTETIEGIIPHNFNNQNALEEVSFTTTAFKRMSKLRFLYLQNVNLRGSFEHIFEDLRFLCWECCPLKCLPSEFYPQKLVTLSLPRSNMRTMWALDMVSKVFEKLKTLNMSYSLDLTTTPDFTTLPSLETLDLERCESLEEVHISIGSLARLVSMNLGGCFKLRSLPDSICNLRALEVLHIAHCSSLYALPIELGGMKSLKELNAGCLTVRELPDSIGHLSNLVMLTLRYNNELKILPHTICSLRALEVLDISGCGKLEILPDQLWKLTRLMELNVGRTKLLNKLPDIKSGQVALSVKKLDLSNSSLTSLPSGIGQLSNLEYLNLRDCHHLSFIEELPLNLKHITADGCTSLKSIIDLTNVKQLEILDITSCCGLREIQGLEELTSIRSLSLGGCNSSLLENIFTKHFFQIYSGFGRVIEIYAKEADLNRVNESSDLGSAVSLDFETNTESEALVNSCTGDLQQKAAHNFLAMILFFTPLKIFNLNRVGYHVNITTSTFTGEYRGLDASYRREPVMVIVPRSIFLITNDDRTIKLQVRNAEILGIRLLCETESEILDSTSLRLE